MDFETCDPEILAAVIDHLDRQDRDQERNQLQQDLRKRMGI